MFYVLNKEIKSVGRNVGATQYVKIILATNWLFCWCVLMVHLFCYKQKEEEPTWMRNCVKRWHLHGILFSSFMNLSFSLEKFSSFSPPPGPAMLVVLEPAVEEEAVVGKGAAASASLRLSFIVTAMRGQPSRCCTCGDRERQNKSGEKGYILFFCFFVCMWQMHVRGSARLVRWLSWRRQCEQLLAQPE